MMSVSVGISSDGDVYVFLSPEDDLSLPVARVEPTFIYLSPEGKRSGTAGGIVHACFPCKISKEEWLSYCPTKSVYARYDIYNSGGQTLITHTGYVSNSSSNSCYELVPIDSFRLAMSTAIKDRMPPEYSCDIPEVFDFDSWGKLEEQCRNSYNALMIPCYDLCGSGNSVWIVDDSSLKSRLRLNDDNVDIDHVNSSLSKLSNYSSYREDDVFPDDPLDLSQLLNVTYVGKMDVIDDSDVIDYANSEGESFGFDGKEWTIEEAFPPMGSGESWLLQVRSEDGFISGASPGCNDLIFSDNALEPVLDWSSTHRRYFFQNKLKDFDVGDTLTNKEYRDGEYKVSEYKVVLDEGCKYFERLNVYGWKFWERRNAFSKLKQEGRKKDRKRISALKKLADDDKLSKDKRRKESNSKDIEALKKLANKVNTTGNNREANGSESEDVISKLEKLRGVAGG